MTSAQAQVSETSASLLPGAVVIARIRRLVFVWIAASVLYSLSVVASKSGCAGGVTEDGGFVDANGNSSLLPPECVSLTLGPSPLMLILIGGIVLWALGRVLRSADGEASAVRIVDRASVAIIIVGAGSVVIAQVWFTLIPLYGIGGTGTYFWPFPFGSVDIQTPPMPTS
jgi:hypothetical protein